MNNKIKSAFDNIHANENIKSKTLNYVISYEPKKKRNSSYKLAYAVLSCCLAVFLVFGGVFSYTTAVASISVDINPSLELEINVYDRVISAKGYNDDGKKLAREVSVLNKPYLDAINNIMCNKSIENLSKNEKNLEITVTSSSEERNNKIKTDIESKTTIEEENIYCSCNNKQKKTANSHGMSHGKYRAYLKLKETNPDITIDEVREMPIDEIRELMNCDQGGGNCRNFNHSHGAHHHKR